MHQLMATPPFSEVDPVTEIIHGIAVTDPYRWLEDQESPRTREWLGAQAQYAREYLDAIPGLNRIRTRIHELLDIETYDSIQRVGENYIFRKRSRGQEQPSIFIRQGPGGEDQLLINPADRKTGRHTSVKPLRLSHDGTLLLYEVKNGGERSGTFELFDLQQRERLPEALPRGYLRGFSFAPDGKSFYYAHESQSATRPHHGTAYHHVLGTAFADDIPVFCAGEREDLRLQIVPGERCLGFLVLRAREKSCTNLYIWHFDQQSPACLVLEDADYKFGPLLVKDRILAITDRDAPNFRIVEVHPRTGRAADFVDIIPTCDCRIRDWTVTNNRIYVSYTRGTSPDIRISDLNGKSLGELAVENDHSVRFIGSSREHDELLIEQESFTKPIQIRRYCGRTGKSHPWAHRQTPFDFRNYSHIQVSFLAKDSTQIPAFLVGRREVLRDGPHPTIMTSYGGYGVPMTPRFSIFASFLMERGCLFAIPNIRGGAEFGAGWHNAARRRNRQVAIDDFIAAAEWLIASRRTEAQKLAIFGGSNSGLLVGAAVTQRPDLFRAVVCMVPMTDMLRYHLFDDTYVWQDEFGSADDPDDFLALARYSPYHAVRDGTAYPAAMIVSGDADQNCNPLHARKMTARLQAANASAHPIILEYNPNRGHTPVLPFGERVEALSDRLAFLCDQLGLGD